MITYEIFSAMIIGAFSGLFSGFIIILSKELLIKIKSYSAGMLVLFSTISLIIISIIIFLLSLLYNFLI